MSENTVTYPRCGCGGILSFATGLPVCVSFDGGDILVEVDMYEVDDIDQPFLCDTCDDASWTDETYDQMATLLVYLSRRMTLEGSLRMPTDGEIAARTAFDGEPIEVVGG